jgi:UDP-GlcNAc:undecaprenyl-phosphate GlcNAc-1-phosphate transferase
MGIYMAQLRVYPEKEFSVLRGKAYTPILIEVTYKKQLLLVVFDFCLIAFAYYLSYRLRFSGSDFIYYFQVFLQSLPAVIACKFLAFFTIGIYRGIWRYMSVNDVYVYLKASAFGSLLAVAVMTFIFRFEDFSKGLFLIDWFLTSGFLLASRGSFRLFIDTMRRRTLSGDRVLLYGAGRGGEILLREILNNARLHLHPVGFVDDDELKAGKKLQGYPILGTSEDLERLLERHGIQGVLVSFRSRSPDQLMRAAAVCRRKNVFIKRFSICLEEVMSPVFVQKDDKKPHEEN